MTAPIRKDSISLFSNSIRYVFSLDIKQNEYWLIAAKVMLGCFMNIKIENHKKTLRQEGKVLL